MQRSSFRLSRTLQGWVYLSFGVLLLSGAGWMLAQRHLEDAGWETVPRLLLKIHGGAAMVALLVLGSLTLHVQRGWRAGQNRFSGALLIAINAFLILSGYGLYYAGGEELREWLSRWHAWIGLATFALLPAHIIVGRMSIARLHREKLDHAGAPASKGTRRLP